MDRSSRQRIRKEIVDLNNIVDQMDLRLYRTFYSTIAEYTFFSSANGTFLRIVHLRPQNNSANSRRLKLCLVSSLTTMA